MRRALLIGAAALALVYFTNAKAQQGATLTTSTGGGQSGQSVKDQAAAIVEEIGFSYQLGEIIGVNDVLALFQIESGFDPLAINYNDGGAGNHAYGIGQMLGTTADDMGYTGQSLLTLENGVTSTMKYLEWIANYLQGRFGRYPTKREVIGAYNMGIGNVANGLLPTAYLLRHSAALLTL